MSKKLIVVFIVLISFIIGSQAQANPGKVGNTCTPCHTDGRTNPPKAVTTTKATTVKTTTVKATTTAPKVAASIIKAGDKVQVTAYRLNFRAIGSAKGKIVDTLSKGTIASVLKVQNGWANVKLSSGKTGWVLASYVKAVPATPATPATPASPATPEVKQPSSLDVVGVISKEWLSAGHAKMVEPLAYAGPRDGCVPCHSGNGLERYGTDKPYKPGKGIKTNTLDSVYTFMFDPHVADMPSSIGCATCHAGTGATILKSGVVPAKLNIFSGGTTDWNVGNANALCLTCHNGRRDVAKVYKDWTTPGTTKANTYPHHGWGALVTGKGGMEYPGVKYAQSTVHQSLGCIGCHMAKTKDGYVSHEFKPDITTCNKCHPGQTEFTMGGSLKKELEEKLATLEKLVLAKIPGAVKIGINNSTAPAVDKDGKRIPAANVSSVEALVGAYNYALVIQELENGGKGVHNPKYARALLNESIQKLQ